MFRKRVLGLGLLGALISGVQGASLPARAVDVQILDEQSLTGLLPAAMLNSSGFNHLDGFDLEVEGLRPDLPVLPMFPMFKSVGSAKKFLGVQIPGKYLSPTGQCQAQPGGTLVVTARPRRESLLGFAMRQISEIEMEDGSKLAPYYHNCTLYGIPKGVTVDPGREMTKGLTFRNTDGDVLHLGEVATFGLSMNLGGPVTYLNGEKGINLAEPFNNIFQNVDMLVNGERAESLIEKTMRFAPYIQAALVKNHESKAAEKDESRVNKLEAPPARKNKNISVDQTKGPRYPVLPAAVPPNLWSSELQNALRDRRASSSIEVDLKVKKQLSATVNEMQVYDSDEANRLVQRVCNYLAQAYDMPEELWPKCRVLASWDPNAMAMPGGDIFISAGLLGILSDLDSVTQVLGHEIGHVIGRHLERQMSSQNAVMYLSSAFSLASSTVTLPFALKGGAGMLGNVNWLTYFPQSLAASVGGGYLAGKAHSVAMFGPVAALMAFGREYEWEADRFGHQAAIAIGAKQERVHSGWGEFRQYIETYLGVPSSLMEKIMSSHPAIRDRETKIQTRYPEIWRNLEGINAKNRLPENFYQVYAKIHQNLQPYVIQYGERHLQDKRKNGGRSIGQEFAAQSLFSPAGQCVQFALGLGGNQQKEEK